MNKSNELKDALPSGTSSRDAMLAFLLLRGWLAVRAILAGLEKFGAYVTVQQPLIDPVTGLADPNAVVDVK
ncbi:MAG: hypothetical protein EBY24_23135, partial [Betaproteobacteria bacterium]|nr:hypothetical protein [Betaproteobacteria bacterium]